MTDEEFQSIARRADRFHTFGSTEVKQLCVTLEQARAELSNVIAERDKLCVDFEAVKAELAKVTAERDEAISSETHEAWKELKAELAACEEIAEERRDRAKRAELAHDKLQNELALANEVIEAAREMDDAYKIVDDGLTTLENEFQFDNAWERFREKRAKYDARRK